MLKNTRSEANLFYAFAKESQAYTKYNLFSDQAKKEGYEEISKIFKLIADNEKAHAEIWYKQIMNGMPNTEGCLNNAINGEHEEWTNMYREFSEQADQEGFEHLAYLFKSVGNIEKGHEEEFQKLLDDVQNDQVFFKNSPTRWECTHCGNIEYNLNAPQNCPVCGKPMGYYKVENK